MTSKIWLVAVALLAMLLPSAASAVTCSGAFGTFNMGAYTGVASSPTTNQGSITCPSGFHYGIGLSAGVGSGATVTLRKMTGPNAATLTYQIFQNSAHTANWGNTNNTDTKSVIGSASAQSLAIYAQIPGSQNLAPGTYQDTVTVSVFNSSPLSTFTASNIAVVSASCTLSASPLAFGNYSGATDDVTATLTATCTKTTPYNIGLSAGTAAGATVTTRAMTGPASVLLNYALFRDSTRSINWGNTVGTDTLAGSGTGTAVAISVYGRIVAGRIVRPGSYVDTVIATITY